MVRGPKPIGETVEDKSKFDNLIHDMDEELTMITDYLPKLWSGLLKALLAEGVNHDPAVRLVVAYIMSQGTNGNTTGK